MKSEPRFDRAQPNIFPSEIGLKPGTFRGFDWVIAILLVLPVLVVYEGPDLARRAWDGIVRRKKYLDADGEQETQPELARGASPRAATVEQV